MAILCCLVAYYLKKQNLLVGFPSTRPSVHPLTIYHCLYSARLSRLALFQQISMHRGQSVNTGCFLDYKPVWWTQQYTCDRCFLHAHITTSKGSSTLEIQTENIVAVATSRCGCKLRIGMSPIQKRCTTANITFACRVGVQSLVKLIFLQGKANNWSVVYVFLRNKKWGCAAAEVDAWTSPTGARCKSICRIGRFSQ